ncbi:hypothetical protein TNCV_502011 [Trichonephila clavipes]|nr:hypothetical protein TNCV_502011 [Trichonephila clavipes]
MLSPALADRPLKVVIKGLPKSTATADIKGRFTGTRSPSNESFAAHAAKIEIPTSHLFSGTQMPEMLERASNRECPIKERLDTPIVSIVTLTATRQTGVAARPSQR